MSANLFVNSRNIEINPDTSKSYRDLFNILLFQLQQVLACDLSFLALLFLEGFQQVLLILQQMLHFFFTYKLHLSLIHI